jgi:hypothetical protein
MLSLLVCLDAQVRADAPTAVLTAMSPESPAKLPPRAPLYVRVEYDSNAPVRIQARGRLEGKEVPAMTNPSPAYPAGKGEAVAWIAFNDAQWIDEVRVTVSDERWRPLLELNQPMRAEWSPAAPQVQPAAWATRLSDAQQRAVSESMRQSAERGSSGGSLVGWLLPLVFLLVPAYPVLQTIALVRLRGTRRRIAALPLLVMLPTYAFCGFALSQASNLWPLWAIFLSPPSAVFVGLALLIRPR